MKRILVIEDNQDVRENIEEILELSGYEVSTAEDGMVGVQVALKASPDLILCDVMMPKLDGFGVLNILSKKPLTKDIPFVFLTAKAEKDDLRRGMNMGAEDYITKPFYKDELLQVIENRLEKIERLKKRFDRTSPELSTFINTARGYQALKKISRQGKTKRFRPKDVVFQEGDLPRYLYFVKKGKIKTFKTNEVGKEFIINICTAGDFLGYTSLIGDENYHFGASSIEESELSLMPRKEFEKLLFANQDVSAQLIKMLADNVAEKEQQLLNLAYNSVRKRVADAILRLHKGYMREGRTQINLLRDDLACIVGTAKESVIRMLTEFKEDGLIEIKGRTIAVRDEQRLRSMLG